MKVANLVSLSRVANLEVASLCASYWLKVYKCTAGLIVVESATRTSQIYTFHQHQTYISAIYALKNTRNMVHLFDDAVRHLSLFVVE